MKIAYLACPITLPGAPDRHKSAYMHDRMVDALAGPVAECGGEIDVVSWDDLDVDPSDYDVGLVGTTWDYILRQGEFLTRLDAWEARGRLENGAKLISWNSSKTYLRELSEKDVDCIATVWLAEPTPEAVQSAFDLLGTDDLIVKPQVGAGAVAQHRFTRGAEIPPLGRPMMAQPFVPTIITEGEFSFLYVDGALSHAVLKRPADRDYRVQPQYGGQEERYIPSPEDIDAATNVLAALDEIPLYARVDMVRNPATGKLTLMELELIEPYMFPEHGPELGGMLIDGLRRRLRA